jgi:hypothetical protein
MSHSGNSLLLNPLHTTPADFWSASMLRKGVAVTAMYPSRPIRYAFDNSYTPTSHKGTITRAYGRTIYTIDHRPAVKVYNEWTGGAISEYMDGGNILSPSTLYPLPPIPRSVLIPRLSQRVYTRRSRLRAMRAYQIK